MRLKVKKMVRTKYEDTAYEKPEYSGKIFMYCSPSWNILFPVVDIIRELRKNTIIGYMYGKGQQMIRTYGTQYYHSVIGYELKKKSDYLNNLKSVKNIFIFSDESDIIATNLINVAKTNKINIICYSNINELYQFNNFSHELIERVSFKKPSDVLEKMYTLLAFDDAKKYYDLFSDFEIIDAPEDTRKTVLEECIEKIKQVQVTENKKKVSTTLFDPHLSKLKKMEYERSQKNTIYPDNLENLAKKELDKQKGLLSRFFNKN